MRLESKELRRLRTENASVSSSLSRLPNSRRSLRGGLSSNGSGRRVWLVSFDASSFVNVSRP